MLIKSRGDIHQIPKNFKRLASIGIAGGFSNIFLFTAYSMTLVVYTISIRRLSILFSTLYGGLFFKEKNIKERLLGAGIMISGVLFITLL